MTNSFYNHTSGVPSAQQRGVSSSVRAEFDSIGVGFDSVATALASLNAATLWVSGTTYALGVCVYSPINSQTYRRIVAGAGTTDPSLDSTNWTQITMGQAATLTSINTGQIGGLRNPIINGDMQVQQRAAVNLSATAQYGLCDQWMILAAGGSGFSGTDAVTTGLTTSSGVMYGVNSASWTAGAFTWQQRMEAANTYRFNSKALTVSCKLYQNTGGSRTFACALYKANTKNTFSGTTLLQTSSTTVAVASGSYVDASFAFNALGATDASNGLMVVIYDNATNTVVSKAYLIGDVRIDIGTVATPFETLDYGIQLLRCQRYYQIVTNNAAYFIPFNSTGAAAYVAVLPYVEFQAEMLAAPTMTYAWGTLSNVTGNPSTNVDKRGMSVYATATASGYGYVYLGTITASAVL
jgi:hypothetical protein